MRDANNQHDKDSFPHFVDHTVISDAKAAETTHIAFQCVAEKWILSQTVDGRGNPRSIRLDDPIQLFGRAGLNPYREDHA